MVTARGAHAFWPADVHDPVADDAVGGDLGGVETFAGEGLDGIAPQGADGEGHVGIDSRSWWTADRAASTGSVLPNTVRLHDRAVDDARRGRRAASRGRSGDRAWRVERGARPARACGRR